MSASLDTLLNYFRSGTAEGERNILDKVFVYVDDLGRIISPTPGNPTLLVGDKGSGKSALIDFVARLVRSQGTPCVSLTPFDIDTSSLNPGASTGDTTRAFYEILLISIAKKLSEENAGWFDGDYANLYHAAVDAKARASDFPGRMGKFISDAAKSITKIDLVAAFPHLTASTREEVELSARKIIGRRNFFLLIDDTDQITSPDEKSHLNRVWSLILAARRVSENIPDLKCIVSLRSEVWSRLQRDESGQRDQADHFRNLVVRLRGSREHIRQILLRRLSLACADLKVYHRDYEEFFDGHGAHAPQSSTFRSWEDLIVVRSRQRPRDAIQLVGALAKQSNYRKKNRIDETIFHEVMPDFSRGIAEQFSQEVVRECPEALEILKSFANAEFDHPGFTMSAEAALKHFHSLPSRFGIHLYGKTIRQEVEQDAFELWRFFYVCDVLNARLSDSSQKDGFRHLSSDDDLSFVSKVRWNELQKTLWEVNTAYRDYLIQIQVEASRQTGLPIKRPRRRR